jgi:hypothetical protein
MPLGFISVNSLNPSYREFQGFAWKLGGRISVETIKKTRKTSANSGKLRFKTSSKINALTIAVACILGTLFEAI